MKRTLTITQLNHVTLALLMFGIYALNVGVTISGEGYAWLIILGLAIGCCILNWIVSGKLAMNYIIFINLSFLLLCFFSRYWATNLELAKAGFNSELLTVVILMCITTFMYTKHDCDVMIKILAFSGLVMFLYFGVTKGFLTVINVRDTGMSSELELNANNLGMKYVVSAACAFLISKEHKRPLGYQILTLVLLALALLTGSRKVIIMIAVIFLIPYILKKRKVKILYIIVSLLGIYAFYLMCMNVPALYEMIGQRIEEVFALFSEKGVGQYTSTGIRLRMMQTGMDLFLKKPFLGYGIANASFYNNGTYLHNNYLELLVGVGVVGTVLYYSMLVLTLKRTISNYKKFKSEKTAVFTMMLVCLFVIDFFVVSYSVRVYQILILFIYRYAWLECHAQQASEGGTINNEIKEI